MPDNSFQGDPYFSSKPKKKFKHPLRVIIIILVIILLCFLLFRIFSDFFIHKKQKTPPLSVGVTTVKTQDVPVYFSALGTVDPDYTITVKTQVNGELKHIYFEDGQMVKAGDLLAEIDCRPYEAQLLQYQGQLERDQALLTNAKVDVIRYVNLLKTNSVAEQTLATQQSLVKQYEGAIKIDQGQIDAVKTSLSYCKIKSPVTGRIGISIIDAGNIVQTSDTNGIAVITTLDPIDVLFSLPEDDLPLVEKAFHKGPLIVEAYDRDQNKLLVKGVLKAIDNQVNVTTGTVNFKAKFKNPTNILFPSQFVNINLKVTTLKNALIIPTGAVQQGAQGPYVYRYNANNTVNYVPVKTSVTFGEYTVILAGLNQNDQVVTVGGDKLSDGAKVSIA